MDSFNEELPALFWVSPNPYPAFLLFFFIL
jgi:hypothetical protein